MYYRQRKLEEALLFSGQFKDALQALLDWLYRMEPGLSEDQPVHGDLDTVNSLVEEHRVNTRSLDVFLYLQLLMLHFFGDIL